MCREGGEIFVVAFYGVPQGPIGSVTVAGVSCAGGQYVALGFLRATTIVHINDWMTEQGL
jgi:hypothetical protein